MDIKLLALIHMSLRYLFFFLRLHESSCDVKKNVRQNIKDVILKQKGWLGAQLVRI